MTAELDLEAKPHHTEDAVKVLAGWRVIEHGQGAAVSYAGRILADLGADVVKVEPIEGACSRWLGASEAGRSGLFEHADAGKRSLAVDDQTESGCALLAKLWSDADCVLLDEQAVDIYAALKEAIPPSAVVVFLTPYGIEGPHRNYRGDAAGMFHAGGGSGVELRARAGESRPVAPTGSLASFDAGVAGVFAVLTVAVARTLGWTAYEREPLVIDISNQEVIASLTRQDIAAYANEGVPSKSPENYGPFLGLVLRCADGEVITHLGDAQWPAWCESIGQTDLVSDPRFASKEARAINADELVATLERWTGMRSRAE